MTHCAHCGAETQNPRFCSRRCAATYNNHRSPKRKRARFNCCVCGASTGHRRKYCDLHQPNSPKVYDGVTLGAIRRQAKYQANALVRRLARRTYASLGLALQCIVCNYSLHVEICHIRAIQSFSDSTPVTLVNSPGNLVALCPNHHWEFDQGLLSL